MPSRSKSETASRSGCAYGTGPAPPSSLAIVSALRVCWPREMRSRHAARSPVESNLARPPRIVVLTVHYTLQLRPEHRRHRLGKFLVPRARLPLLQRDALALRQVLVEQADLLGGEFLIDHVHVRLVVE